MNGILVIKFFSITTDNGSNMIKALDFMQDIIRIPCTAHTLQLVVGKDLLEIENLVKHAKKLMLYFTTPNKLNSFWKLKKNLIVMKIL